MRVISPIGAELKFHSDSGCHAHGEIDAEERAPELRDVAPNGFAGGDVDALHHRKQDREAERQRHKQKMIKRGQGKLQAREREDIHQRDSRSTEMTFCPAMCTAMSSKLRSAGEKNNR